MANTSLTLVYSLRHLLTRKTQTCMTIGGVALVVFVFVATLMLAQGLRETLAATGSFQNVIVLRNGAQNEIQSGISREDAAVILAEPEVLQASDGSPLATKDVVVLVSLHKRSDGLTSNVNVRGVSEQVSRVRSGIQMIEGRLPQPGTREVMVGKAIFQKFAATEVGKNLRLVGTDWRIVGIFDAGKTAFSSEIWGDVEVMLPAFRRERFSSVTFSLAPQANFESMKQRLENDRRLSVTIERESVFYESESKSLGLFIRILGTFISVVFSLGAIIGAMITMYSAVANRTREIGVLRALGFTQGVIFLAFAKECILIGLLGGSVGLFLAFFLQFATIQTTNFSTFSEVAFGFQMTPKIALLGLLFSAVMGLLGGALPAYRAARLQIVTALRAK